jgi:O-antigen/teichoic acid export membrane protein
VSQLFLAGVLMYVMMRGMGGSRVSGAVAAVAYQLCGFYLTSAVFPSVIAGAAWLPLLILMAEYIVRQQPAFGRPATMPWAAVGVVAMGMVVLAGHPEVMMYTGVVVAFYGLVRLAPAARRVLTGEGAAREVLRPLAALALMGALGVALGGVQLVPLVEALRDNFREGAASLSQVRGWALPWRRLIAFLMPNFFGGPTQHSYYDVFAGETVGAAQPIDWGLKNYVEGAAYLGVLTLVLALIGILAPWLERRAARRARTPLPMLQPKGEGAVRLVFLLMAAMSFSFVFGTVSYALIYYGLPGASQLHTPFRWIWPFSLSVAALAGFGAEWIRRMWRSREESPAIIREGWGAGDARGEATWRLLRRLERLLLLVGGLLLAGLVLSRLLFSPLESTIDKLMRGLEGASRVFTDARMFYSYELRQAFVLAVFVIGAGVALRLCRGATSFTLAGRWRVPAWQAAAVGLIAADLLIATWGFYPANDPALLDYRPPVVDFLDAQEGQWRFVTLEEPGADTLSVNTGWFYGFDDVRGYDSIIQGQYTRYMALIYPQYQLEFNRVAPITLDQAAALDSPLLDLLNVRYIVTETRIGNPRYNAVYADESVFVYENTGAMPRAFTLPREAYVCAADEAGEDAAFAEAVKYFDVRYYVIFAQGASSSPAEPRACWPDVPRPDWTRGEPQPAAITRYDTNTVMVDVEIDAPSYLVLADSYYPGWKAFVRSQGADEDAEQALDIYRVNGNFRAVYLDEPGAWTVRFRFSPDSVKVGAFASFLSAVLVVFGLAVWAWMRFYRPDAEDADSSGMVRMARNSLAPIVLQLFNKGIDFVFAFIMLRILEPEGAGKYYYAIVIFVWFDILTNFGLNTLLTREVARDKANANRYFYNSTLLRLALAALGVPVLAGFFYVRQAAVEPPLANDTIITIVLLYLGLIPTSLSTGLTALFYAYEKAEYPAAISTLATIVKATLGIIVLVLGWNIVGLAGASVVTSLVTLAVLSLLARRFFFRPRIEPDRGLIRRMVRASWPLMLSHLLQTVFFKIDVMLLEALRGNAAVGRYSTAYKWLDTLNVIPAFLTMGIFPMMSRQAKEDREALMRSYRLVVKLLVMVALPVAVVTTFTAELLVNLLGGSAYLPDGAIALQIMIWSIPIGWVNSVTNYVLIALDRQHLLMRAFVVGVGFNLIANVIFMPEYGYRAAAVITIFSELVLLVAVYRYIRREVGSVPWFLLFWRLAVATILMGAAVVALWPASAPLALAAGCVVYVGALWVLKPLTPDELALLAPVMPARVRAWMLAGADS